MRISISTWNTLKRHEAEADLFAAIAETKARGFGVELWLDWSAAPGLVEQGGWPRLREACRGATDLSAHSRLVHVFDPAVLREEIDLCRFLGADPLVVHPKSLGLAAGTWDASGELDRSPAVIGRIRELLDYAGSASVRLALENGPMDLLSQVLETFGEHESLGICIDTGHANMHRDLYDEPAVAFLDAFGERVIHLHLSDNSGTGDEHLVPGSGCVDWGAVARAVRKIGYNGHAVLELNERDPPAAALAAVRFVERAFAASA